MRVVRAAGQNVSPSDDGRLFDQIFSDGLFTDTTFTNLGGNSVQVGAMYGDLCGRDFTIEQMTLTVTLPEGEGEVTGYIYVEIDTSSDDVITLNSALAPFTPTYEDINTNGAIAQMILAEYTATAVAVTGVTPVYERAAASAVKAGSIATVESAQATQNHAVGDYILLNGQLYVVTAAVNTGETFIEGTNISAAVIGDTLTALNNGLIQYGTDGIWKYHKYADGTYHLWYDGNINLLSGTAWIGGYYHGSSSDLPLPSFARTVTSVMGTNISGSLTAFVGADMSTRRTYWLNGAVAASTLTVHIDVYGTW